MKRYVCPQHRNQCSCGRKPSRDVDAIIGGNILMLICAFFFLAWPYAVFHSWVADGIWWALIVLVVVIVRVIERKPA